MSHKKIHSSVGAEAYLQRAGVYDTLEELVCDVCLYYDKKQDTPVKFLKEWFQDRHSLLKDRPLCKNKFHKDVHDLIEKLFQQAIVKTPVDFHAFALQVLSQLEQSQTQDNKSSNNILRLTYKQKELYCLYAYDQNTSKFYCPKTRGIVVAGNEAVEISREIFQFVKVLFGKEIAHGIQSSSQLDEKVAICLEKGSKIIHIELETVIDQVPSHIYVSRESLLGASLDFQNINPSFFSQIPSYWSWVLPTYTLQTSKLCSSIKSRLWLMPSLANKNKIPSKFESMFANLSRDEFKSKLIQFKYEQDEISDILSSKIPIERLRSLRVKLNTQIEIDEELNQLVGDLYSSSSRVRGHFLRGGFSGALVFRCESWDIEGNCEEQTICKIDNINDVKDEATRMRKATPFLGGYVPNLLKTTFHQKLGGMKIQLCGACWALPQFVDDNANFITTFKELYGMYNNEESIGNTSADIQDVLNDVFGEIMYKPAMEKRIPKFRSLLSYYNIAALIKKHTPAMESLGSNLSIDVLRQVQMLSTEASSDDDFYYEGKVHGDLNGSNVLIDNQGSCWIIDFAFFGQGHNLCDIAKLETCILFEYTHIDDSEWELAQYVSRHLADMGLFNSLMACNKLQKAIRKKYGRRTKWELLLTTLSKLRQYAAIYAKPTTANNTAAHPSLVQYSYSILSFAMKTLSFKDIGNIQKKWALHYAIQHGKKILRDSMERQSIYRQSISGSFLSTTSTEEFASEEKRFRRSLRWQHGHFTDAITSTRFPIESLRTITRTTRPESEEESLRGSQIQLEDVDLSIASDKRVAIIGPPGSGKSCLLSRIIYSYADEQSDVLPVFLNLEELVHKRYWTQSPKQLVESNTTLLKKFWYDKYGNSIRYPMLMSALTEGRLVLCCSGFDQIPEYSQRVLCWLSACSTWEGTASYGDYSTIVEYPLHVIFTCRSSPGREELFLENNCTTIIIQPITSSIRKAIVEMKTQTKTSVERLKVLACAESEEYQVFCSNPLLFSLLITVLTSFNEGQNILSISELFDYGLKMIVRTVKRRLSHDHAGDHAVEGILNHLAYRTQTNHVSEFNIREILEAAHEWVNSKPCTCCVVETLVQHSCEAISAILSTIHRNTFALIQCQHLTSGLDYRLYTFSLNSFHEYLAARRMHSQIQSNVSSFSAELDTLIQCNKGHKNKIAAELVVEAKLVMKTLRKNLKSKEVKSLLDKLLDVCLQVLDTRTLELHQAKAIIEIEKELLSKLKNASNKRYLGTLVRCICRLQGSHVISMIQRHGTMLQTLFEIAFSQSEDICREYLMQLNDYEVAKNELFCLCASHGFSRLMKYMIHVLKINVDMESHKGWTPLVHAASSSHGEAIGTITVLINAGANVNGKTSIEGRNALYQASLCGNYAVVDTLIANGADVNLSKSGGITPLMAAALKGHADIVQLLLKHGADVSHVSNSNGSSWTAAIKGGDIEVIENLLQHEVSQDRTEIDVLKTKVCRINKNTTFSLFGYAVTCAKYKVTKWLADKGLDPNQPYGTQRPNPLWLAAKLGGVRSAKALISSGANLETVCENGYTPLLIACKYARYKMVKFLVEETKCDLSAKSVDGYGALELCLIRPALSSATVLLQKENVPFDLRRIYWNALNSNKPLEAIQFVMDHLPKPKLEDIEDSLMKSSELGNSAIMMLFFQHVQEIKNHRDVCKKILHHAINQDDRDVVSYLINECNLDLNDIHNGFTPLHRAARRGSIDMVSLLLTHGAELHRKATHPKARGNTAIFEAVKHGHFDVVRHLKQADKQISRTTCLDLINVAKKSGLESTKIENLKNILPFDEVKEEDFEDDEATEEANSNDLCI